MKIRVDRTILKTELNLCRFFKGWTLKDVRELSMFEFNSCVRLAKEADREIKKQARKMKHGKSR